MRKYYEKWKNAVCDESDNKFLKSSLVTGSLCLKYASIIYDFRNCDIFSQMADAYVDIGM